MNKSKSFVKKSGMKVAALFAGCGGDSLGFSKAGFEIVFANDKDPDACYTFKEKFEKKSKGKIVHRGDIKNTYDFGSPEVVTGGFPCQGFSMAGPRKVSDERNELYHYLKLAISLTNPKFFVAENVKGFVTLGEKSGKFFAKDGNIERLGAIASAIIDELSLIGKGYHVQYRILNAKDYGVAQNRERIFIVGVRKDLNYKFLWPSPTHGPMSKNKQPYVTLRKAIGKIPSIAGESYDGYFSSRYISRNRVASWNDVSYTIPAQAGQVPLHPDSHIMGEVNHGIFFETEFDEWKKYKKKYNKIIKKMKRRPSKNFRLFSFDVKDRRMFTGSNADSISWDKLANSKTPKFSNGRPTRLSWRQCAAIQGFPKNYPFYGTVSQIYKQIGNAVSPPVMQKIAENLSPYFDGKKTSLLEKSIKPEPKQESIDVFV